MLGSKLGEFEPPMPPKVTLDQASKLAKVLVKGEPNREKIAVTVLLDKIRELIRPLPVPLWQILAFPQLAFHAPS